LLSSSSSVSVCCSSALYREREYACPPPTHPPFRVWLSWGSSSRCPNQSSVCIVLSDVVELAEMAEMAELLCCCGDEVIYSILSRFFLLCVCVC
jgi:hypothetical protein